MQSERNGITLWFDTPDAPGPPALIAAGAVAAITVGIRPAGHDYHVDVLYRLNSEPIAKRLSCQPIQAPSASLAQYYRAEFPPFRDGDVIHYGVTCNRAGPTLRYGGQANDTMLTGWFRVSSHPESANLPVPGSSRTNFDPERALNDVVRGQHDGQERVETLVANRKLLVSVFNAQEAREAVLGGGRIIDSEDPRSALGNIKPVQIMAIANAVLDFKRDYDVQLSTNIGEDQLLYDRAPNGQAVRKSIYEVAGKSSQAAIGVAASMGTLVHPCNIVKVGVDGMQVDAIVEVVSEVVLTLRRTREYCNSQVMSVLFVQDVALWNERKDNPAVRRTLVEAGEYHPAPSGGTDTFDLQQIAASTLRDSRARVIFSTPEEASLPALIRHGYLPATAASTLVRLNPLFEHSEFFPELASGHRTNQAVIKAIVDATAEAGANAIMLDTSILTKTVNVCLVDTAGGGMIDMNRFRISNELEQKGILSLDDISFFVEYCHYRGLSANLAGSIDSYQAQQLWVLLPEIDQISTRGAASGVAIDPANRSSLGENSRQRRVINRNLVRGLAPPEHNGVLNLPESFAARPGFEEACRDLCSMISERRRELGHPALEAYLVDVSGQRAASIDYHGRVTPLRRESRLN